MQKEASLPHITERAPIRNPKSKLIELVALAAVTTSCSGQNDFPIVPVYAQSETSQEDREAPTPKNTEQPTQKPKIPKDATITPSSFARKDIPPRYLTLYVANEKDHLTWTVLAGIGKVETDHGRAALPGIRSGINKAGCCRGPMQFNTENGKGSQKSTWEVFSKKNDNIYDPRDAIPAAARKLLHDGLAKNKNVTVDPCPELPGTPELHQALKRYNNACWYVKDVITHAQKYGGISNA